MSGIERLKSAFAARNAVGKPAFVGFLTSGYPALESTVPALLTMQASGVDIIEVGIAFSDPLADGGTIAKASEGALKNGVSLAWTLGAVREAREKGLQTPIVLMGYINPILAYGQAKLVADAAAAGVDGFIVVDLLPEDAGGFLAHCGAAGLAFVPLVAPTTPDARLPLIASAASAFVYCVSVTGVTGARTELPPDLADFLRRVRAHVKQPLAVGFGLSTPAHVAAVGGLAEGVVMGSAIVRAMEEGGGALVKLLKEVVPPK
jgi:tryptophan synthase